MAAIVEKYSKEFEERTTARLNEMESSLNHKVDTGNSELREEVSKDVRKIDSDIH